MARSEGALSLMNGFTASMLREVVYSGLRLGSYEYFKDQCATLSALQRNPLLIALSGYTMRHTVHSRGKALASKSWPRRVPLPSDRE